MVNVYIFDVYFSIDLIKNMEPIDILLIYRE